MHVKIAQCTHMHTHFSFPLSILSMCHKVCVTQNYLLQHMQKPSQTFSFFEEPSLWGSGESSCLNSTLHGGGDIVNNTQCTHITGQAALSLSVLWLQGWDTPGQRGAALEHPVRRLLSKAFLTQRPLGINLWGGHGSEGLCM